MHKKFTSLGLMSGTSGDGVDASIVQSNGLDEFEVTENKFFEYDSNLYKDFHQEKANLLYKIKTQKMLNMINKIKNDKSFNNKNIRSLVRLSGTEPLVRILVEGENKNFINYMQNFLRRSQKSAQDQMLKS